MTVSIFEVAKKAGVSIGTVSKVLNKTEGARVGSETRARILQIAEESGYQPNRLARSMVRQSLETIGLMVSGLQNPFFVMILEAIEKELLANGHQVMFDAAPSELGTFLEHGKLRGWPVDGVIMWAFPIQTTTQYLGPVAATLPTVYMGYPREDDSAWVAFDLYGGGRQAAEHLLSAGHRRITFVTPHVDDNSVASDARYLACQDVCKEWGALADLHVIPGWRATRTAAVEAGEKIAALPASQRPKALICHNDITALGIYHGLRRAGLAVPKDMAIVGFDGLEEGRCQDIPLTTVDSPIDILAQKVVEILVARMNKNYDLSTQQVLIPTRLWVGGTSP